ncbi:MAG: ribosome maturation factor RimP [Clostridia bacterium]|nr:ribosome maturation factor RimP [Clostridia bacterium]
MAKAKQNIAGTVRGLVSETVYSLGYELWDVEYVKDGAFWYLRITIDSPKGIDIDDCEKVHRAIDPIIDEADPIEDQYYLEVSSPGVERELRVPEHFERFIGSMVTVKLFVSVNGAKQHIGKLVSYDDGCLVLDVNGEEHRFEKKDISRVNVYFDFDAKAE